MQGDAVVTAESNDTFFTPLWAAIDGFFGLIWSILHPILAAIDPLCGPVGIFSIFFRNGQLSCGNAGWGDEIASGFYVTASLALCTLPLGLVVGFFLALAKQSPVAQLRTAADIYTTLFRGLPELLTLFIVYYGLQIVLQNLAGSLGFAGPNQINSIIDGMISHGLVF